MPDYTEHMTSPIIIPENQYNWQDVYIAYYKIYVLAGVCRVSVFYVTSPWQLALRAATPLHNTWILEYQTHLRIIPIPFQITTYSI
jgi:hypothetical protein